MFRTRSFSFSTEDLAYTFMEEEIGRIHWKDNWPKIKATGEMRQRVQDWLNALQIEHDPDEIVACLDTVVAEKLGKWL